MILLGGATSLLVGNAFQAQMPEFAHDFGHDKQDWAYSMLLGANAAGAAVGGLLLEGTGWLKANARNAAICSILWCLTIVGFAAATNYMLALALLFGSGVTQLGVSLDGADVGAVASAAAVARTIDRLVQYLEQRPARLQRRHGRRRRRVDRHSLVAGDQRHGVIGGDDLRCFALVIPSRGAE